MSSNNFVIEAQKPFSESFIWQLNRDFYQEKGIRAWSHGVVPHNLTSNSKAGKTYAELIFAFLKDLAVKGKTEECVYILELGAGHGRLAFHVLQHLNRLIDSTSKAIPAFCYVLSDIVEDNLSFFQHHPQLQDYYKNGTLDFAHYDAVEQKDLYLRYSKKTISANDLNQPIVAIANYFFDSIPNDLLHIQNKTVADCAIAIDSKENPAGMNTDSLLENMEISYAKTALDKNAYQDVLMNEIVEDYRNDIKNSYLFFPKQGIECLQHIKALSKAGLVLLSMDKGYHDLHDLENKKEPEIVPHGSISIWVNYHALGAYCEKQGGKALFPSFSNFHLEIGCLLFLEEGETYAQTNAAYQQFVDNFGPDDFNSIKKLAYKNVSSLQLSELIALYRLSYYDSTFFIKLLPRLKQAVQRVSFNGRNRIAQTFDAIWEMYFYINEPYDLAYEIGGLLYDLGYYAKALTYFQKSVDLFGLKADIYYNQALCYYQLRQDEKFFEILNKMKNDFPDYELIAHLEKLDVSAV
jgi:SAM-dependent MidA family methyltransferase